MKLPNRPLSEGRGWALRQPPASGHELSRLKVVRLNKTHWHIRRNSHRGPVSDLRKRGWLQKAQRIPEKSILFLSANSSIK